MARSLMAICVLVALALPTCVHGYSAIDNDGSISSVSCSVKPTEEDHLSNREGKTISPLLQEVTSIPAKPRQKRQSDQRRAELEALLGLSKMRAKLIKAMERMGLFERMRRVGRRRRSATTTDVNPPSEGPTPDRCSRVHGAKRNGDAAYLLIS